MFSEILKITPQIDGKDLNKMEKALQGRFTKIAKGFGKGLANILKGGGIAGVALALIDKLLNPLKEVQEAIDRSLSKGDDLATFAAQFNTSAGQLAKVQAMGEASGLDAEGLRMLLVKFQSSISEAQADPNKDTSVRAFAGREDTLEAFFEFIQSLQKLNKNDQMRVQTEVFGERQILKASEFLNADFKELGKTFSRFDSGQLTKAAERLAGMSDLKDRLGAVRNLDDLQAKSGVINSSMIRAQDQSERLNLQKENARIKSYNDLAKISDSVTIIMGYVEQGLALLGKLIGMLTNFLPTVTGAIDRLMKSPMVRGIKGIFGGSDD